MIKTRFAPSPSGLMHLGTPLSRNLRTARRRSDRGQTAAQAALRPCVSACPKARWPFDDLVRCPQSFAALDSGDFVIRRSDGGPACCRIRAISRSPSTDVGADRLDEGLSGKALFLPLRAALTGRIDGPDLADLIALMPRERVRERFATLKKP